MFSKIAPDSNPTVNSRYDFFKVPPTETTAIKRSYISVQPSSIADSGSLIQLVVPPDDAKATNIGDSFAMIRGKFIKKSSRANLPTAADNNMKVIAEDNLAHTLFDRCTLSVNNEEIFHTSNYSQLAYMHTLLTQTKDTKKGRLAIEGWLPSSVDPAKDFADVSAAAVASRKEDIAAGKEIVLVFKPHMLFMDSSRHLPPSTTLKLVMHKADAKAYTLSSEVTCDVEFKITTFEYFICRVELNPAVVSAWNSQLLSGASYLLPVERFRTRSYTVNAGLTEHRISIQEQDTLPLMVCVGLVTQKGVVGDFRLSQFKYSPHNIDSIELTVDGMTVGKRLNCDFAVGDAAHAYAHTLSSLGLMGKSVGNGISYNDFKDNRTVFVWTLIDGHDEEDYADCYHLKQKGSMEIIVRFKAATTSTLSAQVLDLREDIIYQNLEGNTHSIESIV